MDVFKDERFKHVVKDPKFRNVPKKDRKVKIDKRFQAMFTDDKFKLKYSVDQRGRPIKHSQIEDLKKYYDLSEDSEEEDLPKEKATVEKGSKKSEKTFTKNESKEEPCDGSTEENDTLTDEFKVINSSTQERSLLSDKIMERLKDISVDYARGEGILDTDSSSSDEVTTEDSEEEIEHDWGELDKDAEETDEASKRLAVCNLDWDRVRATDIMVLLHSFLPPTGFIESVTIYPSEFGLQRMKEEEIKGPQELTNKKVDSKDDKEESDEDDEFHREKLRQYQMKRLKYYYAVVVFDSEESANKVYTECDRMEYESSATRLDLRFIPDDMTFDQEPKETCSSLPPAGQYKPRLFANTALQQEKVELTWDETDPSRLDLTRRLAQGAAVSDSDLKAFIATSSESENQSSADEEDEGEEDDKDGDSVKEHKEDDIAKYRSLLANIQKEEKKKSKGKVEMEISWNLALENRAREVEEEANNQALTPFEKIIKNKQDKKKISQESDDDLVSSDDDDDDDEDMIDTKKSKKGKQFKIQEDEPSAESKAELELLLAEDEEEAGKKHFSLKAIQEREAKLDKKSNKSKSQADQQTDDFKIDLKDDRFGALFTSHLYNIDPADSHFRKTKAMSDIIAEKAKRRKRKLNEKEMSNGQKQKSSEPQLSSEVTQLLSSVKKKVKINKT